MDSLLCVRKDNAMSELQQRDSEYIASTYARFPVDLERGEGSILWDTDGKKYIDLFDGLCYNV